MLLIGIVFILSYMDSYWVETFKAKSGSKSKNNGSIVTAIVQTTTNVLCHPQNRKCSVDSDCCSKNCQVKNAPWERYAVRKCA